MYTAILLLSIRQLKRTLRNMGLRRRTGLSDSILRRLISASISSRTIAKVIAINIAQLELQGSSILLYRIPSTLVLVAVV